MICVLLLLPLSLGLTVADPVPSAPAATPLLTLGDSATGEEDVCQQQDNEVLSCRYVDVDFDALAAADAPLAFPGGVVMELYESEEDLEGVVSYTFKNDAGAHAILSYSASNGYPSVEGSLSLPQKKAKLRLHDCGDGCQVLVEEKNQFLTPKGAGDEDPADDGGRPPNLSGTAVSSSSRSSLSSSSRAGGQKEISLAIYYTPEYAAKFSDVSLGVATELATLNAEYHESGLPITFVAGCVAQLALDESPDNRLTDIKAAFGTWTNVLNSNDIAVVLYSRIPDGRKNCGRATAKDPLSTDYAIPLVWMAHDCVPRILAHEIGHLLGAGHNIEINTDPGKAHGYLLPGTPYATMMGYETSDHDTPVFEFSSATRTYLGHPLGNAATADNHGVIVANYERYADFGDESSQTCSSNGQGPCRDFYAECAEWGYWCVHGYVDWMRFHCTKTCGGCDVLPTGFSPIPAGPNVG